MRHIPSALSSTILLLALPAAVAAAQSRRAQVLHPDPPPQRGQLGGMAPSPDAGREDARAWDDHDRGHGRRHEDGDDDGRRRGDYDDRGRNDRYLPAIVTTDGRVFADFGSGYEQVLRSCAAQYGQTAAPASQAYTVPTYTTPTYSLPNYGAGTQQPIPFTPPVPAQQTESQKMIGEQQSAAAAAQAAQSACWTSDAQGRIIVVRP